MFNLQRDQRIRVAFFAILICTLTMIAEDVGESMGIAWVIYLDDIHVWEFFILGFLLVGLFVLAKEFRSLASYSGEIEKKLRTASGAFNEFIEVRYDEWNLSPTERATARLLLKGCSNQEISDVRGVALGTVKAQTNAIYTKSGCGGKAQLLSVLLEELTDGKSISSGA